MHPVRKKRLIIILSILMAVSAAVYLILYALNQNLNLFYTPNQISQGEAAKNINIRIGGMVMDNSLIQDHSKPNSPDIEFMVTDNLAEVKVLYSGIIPDLFREGQGVVATGKLNQDNVFVASEILAKHDENYMPKEVSDALKEQGAWVPDENVVEKFNFGNGYEAPKSDTKTETKPNASY